MVVAESVCAGFVYTGYDAVNRVGFSRDCARADDFFVLDRVECGLTVEFLNPLGVAMLIPIKDELARAE